MKSPTEQALDHSLKVLASILVTSKTPFMTAAVLVEGEFYKVKIKLEKVVEGE